MAIQQQISRQREDFARARSQIQQAQKETPKITQQQLRQASAQPLMGRLQRRDILRRQEDLRQAKAQLQEKKSKFETQVAIKAPQYADPEVKAELAQQAKQRIKDEIRNLQEEVDNASGEERNRIRKKIKVYKEALKLKAGQLIQVEASGDIERTAKRIALTGDRFRTGEIEIGGLGYSVAPELQEEFIKSQFRLPTAEDWVKALQERGRSVAPELINQQKTIKVQDIRVPEVQRLPIQETIRKMDTRALKRPQSTVTYAGDYSLPSKKTFFEAFFLGSPMAQREVLSSPGLKQELIKQREKERTLGKGTLSGFGAGIGLTAISGYEFITQAIREPIKVTESLIELPFAGAKRIISGEGFPEIKSATQTPGVTTGRVISELALLKPLGVGGEVIGSGIKQSLTRASGKFRPIETTPFGEQIIRDIPSARGRVLDLNIIPGGRRPSFDVDALKAAQQQAENIPLKTNPQIPKLNTIEEEILDVVKSRGDVASGSFGQNILVKNSRKFKDIDIISDDPLATASAIKSRLNDKVDIDVLRVTDSPIGEFDVYRVKNKRTGKLVADIDPIGVAEEGFLTKFPLRKVDGLLIADPRSRLAAKVQQLGRGKTGAGNKVLIDIEQLTGGQVGTTGATFRGAFGFSPREQAQLIGKRGTLATSQVGLIEPGEKLLLQRELFASPFDPTTRRAQTRVTRLGVTGQEKAGLFDLLFGDVTLKKGKPQILLFEGQKIGKDFKIPFYSSELEVTLEGGKTIQAAKKSSAVTLIGGERVPIYSGEIVKPTRTTTQTNFAKSVLEKSKKSQKKSTQEIFDVGKNLEKELKSMRKPKPYISTSQLMAGLPRVSSKALPTIKRFSGLTSQDILRGFSGRTKLTGGWGSQNPPYDFFSGKITSGTTPKPPRSPPIRLPPRSPPPPPRSPPPPKRTRFKMSKNTGIGKIAKAQSKAYRLFIKRFGKFKPIETGLTRGEALKKGQKITRQTLAATFKIEPTGKLISKKDFDVTIGKEFRTYKIQKGKKIGLQDIFIQRRGTRLGTRSEVSEILRAGRKRKSKKKRRKIFGI